MSEIDYNDVKRQVFVLVASGFEESPVAYCVEKMRHSGIPVTLVGLTSSLTRGKHGVTVQTDELLRDIDWPNDNHIIILPGERECITSLMSDPRVHELIRGALAHDGVIAATRSAENMTKTVAIPTNKSNKFYPQGKQSVEQFVRRLVDIAII